MYLFFFHSDLPQKNIGNWFSNIFSEVAIFFKFCSHNDWVYQKENKISAFVTIWLFRNIGQMTEMQPFLLFFGTGRYNKDPVTLNIVSLILSAMKTHLNPHQFVHHPNSLGLLASRLAHFHLLTTHLNKSYSFITGKF